MDPFQADAIPDWVIYVFLGVLLLGAGGIVWFFVRHMKGD